MTIWIRSGNVKFLNILKPNLNESFFVIFDLAILDQVHDCLRRNVLQLATLEDPIENVTESFIFENGTIAKKEIKSFQTNAKNTNKIKPKYAQKPFKQRHTIIKSQNYHLVEISMQTSS